MEEFLVPFGVVLLHTLLELVVEVGDNLGDILAGLIVPSSFDSLPKLLVRKDLKAQEWDQMAECRKIDLLGLDKSEDLLGREEKDLLHSERKWEEDQEELGRVEQLGEEKVEDNLL